MKYLIRVLVVATALIIGGFGLTTPAQAKSDAVKIGQKWVPRDYLYTTAYYRTKRTVKVVAMGHLGKRAFNQTVKIPKNTVVAGKIGVVGQQNKPCLWINRQGELSYHVLRPAYNQQAGDTLNVQLLSAKRQDFRRVNRPAYLPTWSYGDLYLGNRAATDRLTTTQKIQLTSDGYLEIQKYLPKTGQTTPKPRQSAKINRTRVKGATRYLYFSQKIKGLTLKHVAKSGRTQYRLTMKNLHQPQHVAGFSDDDEPGIYYSLYKLGSKTYYTPIAVDTVY